MENKQYHTADLVLKDFKMAKRKKFILIFLICAAFIFIISMQISVIKNLSEINKYTAENNFHPHTAYTVSDCSIKLHPTKLSFSKRKLQKGDEIKITAKNDKWCRVIYYTDNTVKTGYIKANSLAETEKAERPFEAVSDSEKLQFNSDLYNININETLDLLTHTELTGAEIKWNSSDNSAATVKNGKVVGLKEGTAIISANVQNKTTECIVNVRVINKNAKKALNIMNAYGNIKNYHPSVLYFKNGWNGYKYWMAYTPYENCNDYWENPHIAASNDLISWKEPEGFKNPLEPLPKDYKRGISYNSDTELVYNSDTKKLECWWRNYNRNTGAVSLRRKTTANGVNWSSSEDMLVFDMYKEDALSPALLYENGIYKMWAINQKAGYAVEYRESKNGKNWTEKRRIDIEYENPTYSSWHLDVIHTPKGYEMSLSANLTGTNNRTVMPLFYSYSPDNTEWSKARLLLNPSPEKNGWDDKGIYRSSLMYAEDKYYLFYSGINKKTGPSGIGVISGSNVFHMS